MSNYKKRVVTGVVLAGTMFGTALILAQDSASQTTTQGAPMAQYRVKQLLGSKVYVNGNSSVGIVDDLVFDDTGTVEYLIVQNQGALVTVPWEAAKFNFEKRTAMIQITPEQYRQIPTYTVDQYPAFATPTYRSQTYQYYGLTPGQERRLNRRLQNSVN